MNLEYTSEKTLERLVKRVLGNKSSLKPFLLHESFSLHFPFGMEKERKSIAKFLNSHGGRIVFDF